MTIVSLFLKFARAQRNARVRYRETLKVWQGQFSRLLHRYRPEFHYMRGPGPKWREKHGDKAGAKR